jgi:hypothetical protein
MKNLMKSTLIFGLLVFAIGCGKKETVDPTKGFSEQIQKIVPQSILDSLQKKGLVINQGTVPPSLEGIFLCSLNELVSNYGAGDSYKTGDLFADYKYKIYEQSTDKLTIKLDYKGIGTSDNGIGKGSFVSGNGNFFTIFSETSGTSGSLITYKALDIYSGEMTSTGIKNFQKGFVLTDKTNDPNNTSLIAVGKGRVFKDKDGLAEKANSFRKAISEHEPISIIGQAEN